MEMRFKRTLQRFTECEQSISKGVKHNGVYKR